MGLQQNHQDVWYLFGAILAHKLVIAFCVGLELLVSGTKVRMKGRRGLLQFVVTSERIVKVFLLSRYSSYPF